MSTATPVAARPSLLVRAADRLAAVLRDPNPILVKELRSTFRAKLFIRFLYVSTAVIGGIVVLGGAAVASGPLPPADVGKIVFQIFFGTALMLIALVAPAYAATAITSERELRTYESLVLSGMGAWRIVSGKLLAVYASMFLVLVAQAPVVGVAFLFGGISLGQVIGGYAGLLAALGPAVAFGLAVSARIASTRVAILIALVVFAPTAFVLATIVTALGEPASSAWGVSMSGPFWFADALASRLFEPDTFGTLVLLPLYVIGMPTWLFLASAVAGVRPAVEDRSAPFKPWAIVTVLGLVVSCGLLPLLTGSPEETGEVGTGLAIGGASVLFFVALVFMNEPALPPRLAAVGRGLVGRSLSTLFGAGAAATLRFTLLLLVTAPLVVAVVQVVPRYVYFSWYAMNDSFDAAQVALAVGLAAELFFFASFGTWLRVVLRSGVAARVLAVATMVLFAVFPFMAYAVIDPTIFDRLDTEIPAIILASPISPAILAVDIADFKMSSMEAAMAVVPAFIYGGLGAVFFMLVEYHCYRARRVDAERLKQREERKRTSRPSVPLLQRASRPSGEGKKEEDGEGEGEGGSGTGTGTGTGTGSESESESESGSGTEEPPS